jgi:hypothetical protein
LLTSRNNRTTASNARTVQIHKYKTLSRQQKSNVVAVKTVTIITVIIILIIIPSVAPRSPVSRRATEVHTFEH